MSTRPDVLTDHEYDGIQEYDNPTPGWWHWIFWGTVVFSACYFVFFHMSPESWTVEESYELAVARNLEQQFSEIGDLTPDEATIVRFMDDEKWLKVGKSTFAAECVTCHGADASGLVGPNLTDEHFKNVKTITDIASVVMNGAANGAMPAQKNRMHPNKIVLVSSYVASLRGQNLPGPRGAEGEVIPPWPAATETESSATDTPNEQQP